MTWARVSIAAGLVLLSAATLIAGQGTPPDRPAAADPPPPAAREDTRTQYPAFLVNSYFSVSLGYIDYAFSDRQLEPGLHAASIAIPHVAARVAVFGHELGPHFAAQLTYMRPMRYVTYTNVDGDGSPHHVWTHFGGVTLKARMPIAERTSIYGEAGLGITSRHGFARDATHPVVRDAQYASFLAGGGVERRISPTWDLTAGAIYSPASERNAEPRAVMVSGGFRYTMRPLPAERVAANERAGFTFPVNLVQVEYSTGYGYAINTFLSKRVPVFWGGNVRVDRGLAVHYDRNVFHTRKIFALDLGASMSSWRSRSGHDGFVTMSAYPLLRFTFLRTRPADAYFCYSLAGPTYISRQTLDGLDTGRHFTFQDFMGAGMFLGRQRRVAAGVKINHYSNGNIFTENAGVKIPLTVTLGYTF
jgi:Lipid A 3-O-deacylase (PagL)/OmpA-like transmembrane domain